MLINESVQNFTDKLASKAPTPGGGGAAALAGALGAALVSMMANLTVGKKDYADVESEIKLLAGELEVARAELLKLVDEDAKAYQGIVDCYAMPKGTEAEKILRSERLAKAAQFAALVPLRIGEHSAKAAALAVRVAELGNVNLLTDAASGVILALAAIDCAEYNVRINLPLTKNQDFIDTTAAAMQKIRRQAAFDKARVLAMAEDVFN